LISKLWNKILDKRKFNSTYSKLYFWFFINLQAGNELVVEELLQCGDRDIAAKNHDGHCAVHLAAFFGHSKILLLLIKFGANVNVANSSGYTPLHMACQSNGYEVLEILLKANANPTIRNHISRLVVSQMTHNLFVLYSKITRP
jgi:ankyrin repeat protein